MKRFLEMGKGARGVKKPEIFSSIIPMFYLSKLVGLAPLSLAYTNNKQGRDGVTLKTSVPAVLYTVLWIIGIAAAYLFILTFVSFNTLLFWTARTKTVLVSKLVVSGITCVASLSIGLTRIRKGMDSLLYKISVTDTLLGTKTDILRSNEIYMWRQVTLLAFVLFIVYANDFVSAPAYSDFTVGMCATAIYICNFIRNVTIMQYVNLVCLLKQKFKILNNYLASDEISTQHRTNNNLWEMLLQTSCFRNENNLKDDALQIEAFYQALNRQYYNNITIQGSTNICIQNSWLHKEKLRCRALRIIWNVLCDISSSVNSVYGLQILLCIVSAFIEITVNLSYSIIALKVNVSTYEEVYIKVVTPAMWALMQFLLMFWIVASCSAACGEANRFVTLLQNLLLLPELHPATAAEIQLFLHQARDRKPKFTAWDVFTINYSLLGSTVGAVTTSLVILVQMQAT
jgi:hypothetical protein